MARKAGRGDPIITEERVTEFLRQQSPPLAGTTQIAEQFDVARTSVIERLNTLHEWGVLERIKVGQSYAWYLEEWKSGVEEGNNSSNRQNTKSNDGSECVSKSEVKDIARNIANEQINERVVPKAQE